MQSFAALAFAGVAVAQAGYGAPPPPAYGGAPPPAYGGANTTSSSTSATIPTYPSTTTFACNPAHQYPEGQHCTTIGGSLTLVTKTSATVPASYPTSSSVCPAAGSTDSKGRYSCNPAHAYPTGQVCKFVDGCFYLEYPATTSAAKYPTTSATVPASYPTSSSVCPAAGSTDNKGRYSCNPAHQYPNGQTCELVGSCYFLKYPATTSSAVKPPTYGASTTTSAAKYSSSAACPAPGSTDNKGRYSCNPAHAYPTGQTCELVDGCYFLKYPASSTSSTPAKYTTKIVTDYTTYCPEPTTFTHGPSTYTITKATTIVLPCPGGCTKTVPVYSVPTYAPSKSESKPAPSHPVYYNTTISQPPTYTTEVITSLTTYCPQPTTFTHGPSTYTVTKATTIVLPCPGGCTVTKSIPATTQTKIVTESKVMPNVTTVVVSPPPVTQTSVYTAITTVCSSTTITHQASTYVVSSATTLTLPCAGGCTVTKEIPSEPKTTVITASVPAHPTTTLVSVPVEPKTSVVTPPAPPAPPATTAPATTAPVIPVYSSPTSTAATATTTGPVQYTGAASRQTAGAIMAVAAAALFL